MYISLKEVKEELKNLKQEISQNNISNESDEIQLVKEEPVKENDKKTGNKINKLFDGEEVFFIEEIDLTSKDNNIELDIQKPDEKV